MNRAARHRQRRERNQLAKVRPQRVLEYVRHWAHPVPFIVFEYQSGYGLRIEIGPKGGIKFHSFHMSLEDHTGRRELPPEDWPDPVCRWMAERALTEGA